MRTTVTLADDVAAAVEQFGRQRSVSTSEAVNQLVRAGLSARAERSVGFRQTSHDLGRSIDLNSISDTLETIDGPAGIAR